jgi:hypothetical protein
MADNIVGGLFGFDQAQYDMQQRQQRQQEFARDFQAVQLSPLEQSKLAILQGTRAFGRGVGTLLGAQDPQLQKVSAIKQLSSQFDLTSPVGMRDFARSLQAQFPQEAMLAAKRADEMETSGLTRQKTQMDITRTQGLISKEDAAAAQNEQLRAELSDAVQRGAPRQEITRIAAKYGSADKILQVLSQEQNRADALAAKSAGEGGVGTPGPVGKSGAYRDISGTILGPAEMKTVRQEFEGAQKLLNTLNQISAQDVKDAESYIDWTTKAETKGLASDKTLKAQTKVAASQLLEQINQLPPGSASDADMRAAMKSFPGYSNPEALAEWVNRTKGLLQFSINRGVDQFGFTSRIQPTAPLDLSKKKSKAQTTTSDDELINKYIKAKTQ